MFFFKFHFMQLFSADATIFLKNKKIKNLPKTTALKSSS